MHVGIFLVFPLISANSHRKFKKYKIYGYNTNKILLYIYTMNHAFPETNGDLIFNGNTTDMDT